MRIADIEKYAALLFEAYALEEKFRKSPPTDPAAYRAAVAEIKALWAEAEAIIYGSELTAKDLLNLREETTRINQAVPVDTRPHEQPPEVIPPIETKPPAAAFPLDDYMRELDTKPDVTLLIQGDVLAQKPNGKYVVGMHGIGFPGGLPAGWTQLWP